MKPSDEFSAEPPDDWNEPPPFVPSIEPRVADQETRTRDAFRSLSESGDPLLTRGKIGRFKIYGVIGEGGMGTVYAAFDPLREQHVAIKVLRQELIENPEIRRRFQREAELLSAVDSCYVVRMLEFVEVTGCWCLVQELVQGQSLAQFVESEGKVTESDALNVMVDIAGALCELHARGIIHRDVKPDNILLCLRDNAAVSDVAAFPMIAKLADFGVARQTQSHESVAMTAADSLLGTPLYMSPEHFYGGDLVDQRSDLYSLGVTLYYCLTGQTPFKADHPLGLADAQRHLPAPNPQTINNQLSDGICEVIQKLLQKRPDLRYDSAAEFRADLLRLQRGEATNVTAHPQLPISDKARMATFRFSWDLHAAPEALWTFVSDTDRLNRAIGLPPVSFEMRQSDSGQRRLMAEVRFAGLRMEWQEHMFEWIEAQRFSVLRQYRRGPLRWLVSAVELTRRADGGTTLTHTFKVSGRHLPGLWFARFQFTVLIRRALDRVYRRIDAVIAQRPSVSGADEFEETRPLKNSATALLQRVIDKLSQEGVDQETLLRITDFVTIAPAQAISRIRPRRLAQRLNLPVEKVIDVCLHGVNAGLFNLQWEVICPSCRIPAQSHHTIADIKLHTRCEACNFDFEVDFATRVELVFQTVSEIRKPETGHFCIGGPAHSPHVVAQARVASGETLSVGLQLAVGEYVLRGPQLPFSIRLNVTAEASHDRLRIELKGGSQASAVALRTGQQLLIVSNQEATEIVVRIERSAVVDDGFTALQAAALPYFCRLFPGEIPSAQQIVSLQHMTFMIVTTASDNRLTTAFGELAACELLRRHGELLSDFAARFSGSYVRLYGEGALLAFRNSISALNAATRISDTIPQIEGVAAWRPVVAIHTGQAMVTTLNSRLDYLGSPLRIVELLASAGRAGDLIVSEVVAEGISQTSISDLPEELVSGASFPIPATDGSLVHGIRLRLVPRSLSER